MNSLVFKSVKWTATASAFVTVAQLLQLLVLTHYLAPQDFGLLAIVMVVIGFAQAFMDMGLGNAIIYYQKVTKLQMSTLYWINMIASLIVAFVVFVSAKWVSAFYAELQLQKLLELLACTFVLTAVGNQYRLLFQKNLKFRLIGLVDVAASSASLAAAAYFAAANYGVLSVVYSTLIGVSCSSAIFLLLGVRAIGAPTLQFSLGVVKDFLRFGLYQMGEKSIIYFNGQLDVLIMGKVLGVESTGLYSVTKTLAMKVIGLINPIVTKVTFPHMAKVQGDIRAVREMYVASVFYVALIGFPVYVAMMFLAEPIVFVVLGSAWHGAASVFCVLSAYASTRSTGNPVGALMLACGRAKLGFYWNFVVFFISPFVVVLGCAYGAIGVAVALLGFSIGLKIPEYYFVVKPLSQASIEDYLRSFLTPLAYAAGAAFFALPSLLIDDRLLRVAVFSIIMFSFYALIVGYFERERIKGFFWGA